MYEIFSHSNARVPLLNFKQSISMLQGFTKFCFTPLETLAIIQHIQKRVGRIFTKQEIEDGILKEYITDEDYDITKVVSTYVQYSGYPNLINNVVK